MAEILDGRSFAEEIKGHVREDVLKLKERGIQVGLGLLLVGDHPASRQYYRATLKACQKVGVRALEFRLPEDSSQNEILNMVQAINADERVNGLLVLFPLPRSINPRRIVNEIVPEKDVDGLGAISVGRLAAEESTFQIFKELSYAELRTSRVTAMVTSFLPCTPFGVMKLLERYNIDVKGKNAVVLGKSLAVGKPLSLMLLAKEATVTICHKETKDLAGVVQQADIICSATGVAGLIRGDMVKEGAVVVDIGINVLPDGRIVGDVEFDSVAPKASYITPVPGGVGPVTISILLENTLRSAQSHEFLKNPYSLKIDLSR